MKFKSFSVDDTQRIANEFANKLERGNSVAFYGELGAGKTTFIQQVAKSLGIKQQLKSPTFIIARNYDIPQAKGTLWHIDLYRLSSAAVLKSINLEEILQDPNNITLIEWAEKAENLLPETSINIEIKILAKNQRQIVIK